MPFPDVDVDGHEDGSYVAFVLNGLLALPVVAGADEILVSAPIAALLDGAVVSEPRRLDLKGFREPVEVVAVDWH